MVPVMDGSNIHDSPRNMFVCCLASLIFLQFPLLFGIGKCSVEEEEIGSDVGGAMLISLEPSSGH